MADDYGAIGGFAKGVQGFMQGFNSARDRGLQERKLKKDEEQQALLNKLKERELKIQLVKAGLIEDPSGEVSLSPQEIEKNEVESATKIGGLLKEGVRPTTGSLAEKANGFEQYVTPEQQAKLDEARFRTQATQSNVQKREARQSSLDEKKAKQEWFKNVMDLRKERSGLPLTKDTQDTVVNFQKIKNKG